MHHNVRKHMRALFIISLYFHVSYVSASNKDVEILALDNGQVLHIKEIIFNRMLPHTFYDQAITSITEIYPNSQIIAKRRIGYLGKDIHSIYSIICYKKIKELEEVTISGVVTDNKNAWSFDINVAESLFADTLLLILEVISDFPLDSAVQLNTENEN